MDLHPSFNRRPLTLDQAGGLANLMAVIAVADSDDEVFGEEDLIEDFADPSHDFADGSIAVYDGETMVGYCILTAKDAADPIHDMRQAGGVHPDYRGRGIGSWLLDWSERAAIPLHQRRFPGRPLSLSGHTLTGNAAAVEMFAARDYPAVRWFHLMECDLSADLRCPPPPEDVKIVGFTDERSADAMLIRNEAFRDHWGSTEMTPDRWAHYATLRVARPDYSFLAYTGDEPAGMIISQEYDAYNEAAGHRDLYVAMVATRRAGRKRGIASALLALAITTAKADGFGSASLSVDADSQTGAVGLYERLGFAVTSTSVVMQKPLPEGEVAV